MGPLISAEQRERVAGFVERAAQKPHIEITAGGKARSGGGFFFEPTVIAGREAERRDRAARGLRPGRLGHALQGSGRRRSPGPTTRTTASRRRCGRKDVGKAMTVAARLQYGCTWINTHFMLVSEMPHGGMKRSGYGKDLSMYALEDYTVRAPRDGQAVGPASLRSGERRCFFRQRMIGSHSRSQLRERLG